MEKMKNEELKIEDERWMLGWKKGLLSYEAECFNDSNQSGRGIPVPGHATTTRGSLPEMR
jgi:hypothetical protein